MGRKKKVRCTKCNKPLFYLPAGYDMGVDIVCVECADEKESTPAKKKSRLPVKKKVIQTATQRFANVKKGKREDLGEDSFRSASEANFARILKHLNVSYKFEQRTFFFHDYKVRPFQYTPDFQIESGNNNWPSNTWIEVKGYMDSASRNKLKRFKKCYPDEAAKMIVVLHKNKQAIEFCIKNKINYILYDELAKQYSSSIPEWE